MPQRRSPSHGTPPRRGRELLLALPPGAVALVALWFGDDRLNRRDWLVGTLVFGLGLAFLFLAVRQLRRAGLMR
jgi:hypothetical protein